MLNSLNVFYPELPPSSNRIFFRGTILTKQARAYAENFSQFMIQNYGHILQEMDKDAIYWLHLEFYFPTLINETFGDLTLPISRRAKTRYKRIDLTNRVKLLEDCIRDSLDIDDSQTFRASMAKYHNPVKQGVLICVVPVDPKSYGLPF